MRTKLMDGEVYNLIRVRKDSCTNEEHFKNDFGELFDHYRSILTVKEMETFIADVMIQRLKA